MVCDVLVLHGCLVLLSILSPLSFSSSLWESGVLRGKQRAAKAMHLCVCLCLLWEGGEEEEERGGRVAAGKASQGREGKEGRGK